MAFAKPNTTLSPLLNQWKSLLQQWAKGGSLATAAQEALLLSGIPEGLQILIDEWAAADFKSLPEVELLSAADINGALGAYAISTGKIYLNENWLEGASKEDVFAVLTEELGHHLDGLLNALDTSGDEGSYFAALLKNEPLSRQGAQRLRIKNDTGEILIASQHKETVENATNTIVSQGDLLKEYPAEGTIWVSDKGFNLIGWHHSNLFWDPENPKFGKAVSNTDRGDEVYWVTSNNKVITAPFLIKKKRNDDQTIKHGRVSLTNQTGEVFKWFEGDTLTINILNDLDGLSNNQADYYYQWFLNTSGYIPLPNSNKKQYTIPSGLGTGYYSAFVGYFDKEGFWNQRWIGGPAQSPSVKAINSGIASLQISSLEITRSVRPYGWINNVAFIDINIEVTTIGDPDGDPSNKNELGQYKDNNTYIWLRDGLEIQRGTSKKLTIQASNNLGRTVNQGTYTLKVLYTDTQGFQNTTDAISIITTKGVDLNNQTGEIYNWGADFNSPASEMLVPTVRYNGTVIYETTNISVTLDPALLALDPDGLSSSPNLRYRFGFKTTQETKYTNYQSLKDVNEFVPIRDLVYLSDHSWRQRSEWAFNSDAWFAEVEYRDAKGFTNIIRSKNFTLQRSKEFLSGPGISLGRFDKEIFITRDEKELRIEAGKPIEDRDNIIQKTNYGPISGVTYRWTKDGSEIANSTNSSLTVPLENAFGEYRLEASYTDLNGFSNKISQSINANKENISPAGKAKLELWGRTSGQRELAVNIESINDKDKPKDAVLFRWMRNGVIVDETLSPNYSINQQGEYKVQITYTDYQGFIQSVDSDPINVPASLNKNAGKLTFQNLYDKGNYIVESYGLLALLSDADGLQQETMDAKYRWYVDIYSWDQDFNKPIPTKVFLSDTNYLNIFEKINHIGDYQSKPYCEVTYRDALGYTSKLVEYTTKSNSKIDNGTAAFSLTGPGDVNSTKDGDTIRLRIEKSDPDGIWENNNISDIRFFDKNNKLLKHIWNNPDFKPIYIDGEYVKIKDGSHGFDNYFHSRNFYGDHSEVYKLPAINDSSLLSYATITYKDRQDFESTIKTNNLVAARTDQGFAQLSNLHESNIYPGSYTQDEPSWFVVASLSDPEGISRVSSITYKSGGVSRNIAEATLKTPSEEGYCFIDGKLYIPRSKIDIPDDFLDLSVNVVDGDDYSYILPAKLKLYPINKGRASLKPIISETQGLLGDFTEGQDITAGLPFDDPEGFASDPHQLVYWKYLNLKGQLTDLPQGNKLHIPENGSGWYWYEVSYNDGRLFRESITSDPIFANAVNNGSGKPIIKARDSLGKFIRSEPALYLQYLSIIGDPDGNFNSPKSFQWYKNGKAIPDGQSSGLLIDSPGESDRYSLKIAYIDAQGFEETSESKIFQANSIIKIKSSDTVVKEDEGRGLTFLFRREGDASSELMVGYSISGTGATSATIDGYRFPIGETRYLNFAVGANSAAVTVNPIADKDFEADETISLTLVKGLGYKIGTAEAVVRVIANDDVPFNLDIDGDGKVTALGDGLMVIRKLFGFAFAGDSLTNKAISSTATRTTAEIHQFIQSGISTGMLDVDKDGKTTALGDGLMVIRHLFGAAFAGAALTNKAISPDSPYFGPPVDHLTIANAIDSMKVIPGLSA